MVDGRDIHFPVKFYKRSVQNSAICTEAVSIFSRRLKAEVDNILHALHNSYHPTQPHSIIANANANANDNDSDNYTDSNNDNDNNNDNYNNIHLHSFLYT